MKKTGKFVSAVNVKTGMSRKGAMMKAKEILKKKNLSNLVTVKIIPLTTFGKTLLKLARKKRK